MTTSRSLGDTARRWLAASRPVMEVCVHNTLGSVPREVGARMLVCDGETAGTIGGGHLELKAIAHAREMLAAGEVLSQDRHYPLGPALGQCCGGAVTLRTRRLSTEALADWPATAPLFTLQLYGAGHVGRAIARLLETIDCQVQWIDERESEFPAAGSAENIERICVEPVQAEVTLAPSGAFFLVLTHSHDLDLAITEAILRRNDFGYLGLIGSATKRARFVHRFEQRGVPAAVVARITCPIGVAGIGGKPPEVIAVAVVAQLLQCAAARSATLG